MALPPIQHPRPEDGDFTITKKPKISSGVTSFAISRRRSQTGKEKNHKLEVLIEAARAEMTSFLSPSRAPKDVLKCRVAYNLPTLKILCDCLRSCHMSTFETRMNVFLRLFEESQENNTTVHSLSCDHPNSVIENKLLIRVSRLSGPTVFSTGVTSTAHLYVLKIFEVSQGIYNKNKPNLELRFTADGKYGELVQIVGTNTLKGNELRDIYLVFERIFTGEWCVKDNAVKKWITDGDTFELCLRFCALGSGSTWFQRSFGYNTVGEKYTHNFGPYDHALSTLCSFRISVVWSFMHQYKEAKFFQKLCNLAFSKENENSVIDPSNKTLKELYSAVMKRSLSHESSVLAEDQAELQKLLFNQPPTFKENGHSPETIYWKMIRVLKDTKVFKKHLS